jgi:hypothetical protein
MPGQFLVLLNSTTQAVCLAKNDLRIRQTLLSCLGKI